MTRVGVLLLLACCAQPVGGGITTDVVIYQTDFDTSDVDRVEGGWQVRNDLGQLVTITAGGLYVHEVSLAPCEQLVASLSTTAWAGHSDDSDESTLFVGTWEDLSDLQGIGAGSLAVPSSRYCEAHWLIASADVEGEPLSLWLEGEVLLVDGAVVPLSFHTDLAWGALYTLPAEGDARLLTTSWVRSPATWFDGVDFRSDDDASRVILRNIFDNSVIDVFIEE